MSEEESVENDLDRRTMIRRTALVGGSLVWATPAVQSLGGSALANTATGSPPPDKDGNAPSNVVLLLLCEGVYYQIKFDAGSAAPSCGPKEDPPLPVGARERWNDLTSGYEIVDGCPPGVTGSSSDVNQPICVSLGDCELVMWGVFDGGGSTQVFFTNIDTIPTGFSVSQEGSTICFSKSF
jgi:hypothetical protein